jgi:hypothetical protein
MGASNGALGERLKIRALEQIVEGKARLLVSANRFDRLTLA